MMPNLWDLFAVWTWPDVQLILHAHKSQIASMSRQTYKCGHTEIIQLNHMDARAWKLRANFSINWLLTNSCSIQKICWGDFQSSKFSLAHKISFIFKGPCNKSSKHSETTHFLDFCSDVDYAAPVSCNWMTTQQSPKSCHIILLGNFLTI
jgi:hypothetical protein